MIWVSAGDHSGDIFGARLISEIKKLEPSVKVYGIGGKNMRKVCDKFLIDLVGMSLFGFWEPLKKAPNILAAVKMLGEYMKKQRPKLLVVVDYYGFHIKLAEIANSLGIPVLYYICPQVWASRPKRMKKLKKYITEFFITYPFEKEIYKRENLKFKYVGNPLMEIIKEEDFSDNGEFIGLFPGSRENVIRWHLGFYTKLIEKIEKEFGIKTFIFGIKHLEKIYSGVKNVIFEESYGFRKHLKFAISTSGSVVLENSLFGIPTIVTFKLPILSYLIAKKIVKVPYISIPNIIFGEPVLPELIQSRADIKNVISILNAWLQDSENVARLKQKLKGLRDYFGKMNTSELVAKNVLQYL